MIAAANVRLSSKIDWGVGLFKKFSIMFLAYGSLAFASETIISDVPCHFSVHKTVIYGSQIKHQTIGLYKIDFKVESKQGSAKIYQKRTLIKEAGSSPVFPLDKFTNIYKYRWNFMRWGFKRYDHFKIFLTLDRKNVEKLTGQLSPSTSD